MADEPTGVGTPRGVSSREVVQGGLWNALARTLPQLYVLVTSVVAARVLGPDDMGRQSFIAFASLSLTTVLAGSMYVALTRYVAETRGRGRDDLVRGLVSWAWRVQFLAAGAGGAVLLVVAAGGAEPRAAWVLAAVVTALGILHTVPTAVLFGLERFRDASLVALVVGPVSTVATVAVLAAGGGITGMFAVEAVFAMVYLLATGTLAQRGVRRQGVPAVSDRGLHRRVLGYAAASTLAVFVGLVVGRRSELYFLERFSTDAEIALYSIPFGVVAAVAGVHQALTTAAAAAFARTFGAGESDRLRTGFARAARLMLVTALPVTALGAVVGPGVLVAVYGDDYRGAAPVFLLLLLAYPFAPLASLAGAVLTGLARIRIPLITSVFAAAVDVGVAAVLVPVLDARGAALANVAGQVALAVPTVVYVRRLLGPLDWAASAVIRSGVAATLALGAGLGLDWLVPGAAGLVAAGAGAAAIFAAAAMALKVLPAEDAAWIEQSFGHVLRRPGLWFVTAIAERR